MERLRLPAAQVLANGDPVACATWLGYAGAYQLTLSSTLAELGIELHSSYLGHPAAPVAIVSHLLLAPEREPRAWAIEHPAATLPVAHARRRCALDHFAVLHDELAGLLGAVRLDVDDAALDLLDRA